MLEDTLKERDELFNDIKFYISPNNQMTFSVSVEPVDLVMKTLTDTL